MYKAETTRLVARTREEVLAGHSFSSGLRLEKGVFPTIALKMIEAGEKTGSLDGAMHDIAEYLDRQVARTLATVTTMIEPLMLVFVGVMIGGMMLAIIAPIYGLIGNFGSR
jgi:type II secretory pathway component PulF